MVKDVIDRVEALAEQFVVEFKEQFQGLAYGLNQLTDEQHAFWYEQQVAKYPPEVFKTKDGQMIVGSPWVLMLPFTTNGEAETRRYMKTRGVG
jgi:hypothetical protein